MCREAGRAGKWEEHSGILSESGGPSRWRGDKKGRSQCSPGVSGGTGPAHAYKSHRVGVRRAQATKALTSCGFRQKL